jgi:hypothetical protein
MPIAHAIGIDDAPISQTHPHRAPDRQRRHHRRVVTPAMKAAVAPSLSPKRGRDSQAATRFRPEIAIW